MHFWALTHLQTVMCASIEECQSVPVSKRTWSLYATTTKHLNLFFRFSHIWTYFMLTSLIVCLQHLGSLLFWTNDDQISKQIQYVVQWESLWLFVFFQVCQIIQLKLFAQQKSNTPGFMIHKTRPIKRIKSQIGHNFLISCQTVTKQSLKTRLEKKC